MVADSLTCPTCHAPRIEGESACPVCGSPFPTSNPLPDSTLGPPNTTLAAGSLTQSPGGPENGEAAPPNETTRRIARLKQWVETARPLGIELPSLPLWAEEMARSGGGVETWSGVLRGIERLDQKKVLSALEGWEAQTKGRLIRLAAYAVEGRLEREQMEDVLHAARAGEVSQALATFQQVDRVITLKERHIDQAREELERLVSLLRDMQALGIRPPQDPAVASEELERELRGGRLAPLKQRLRTLRQEALNELKNEMPHYVAEYGSSLVQERTEGTPVELEVAELARGTREFIEGKVEESLRRLRVLAQVHGASFPRLGRVEPTSASSEGSPDSTEVSRKA